MAKRLRQQRRVGDLFAIPLEDRTFGFGRVLREPLVAIYNLRGVEPFSAEQIVKAPIAFKLFVMNYAITDGLWKVFGNIAISEDLAEEPLFFKKDSISGVLTIYKDSTGKQIPATLEQCKELECAAVWEPEHVADRLADYFAGRPNKFAESLRP